MLKFLDVTDLVNIFCIYMIKNGQKRVLESGIEKKMGFSHKFLN